MATRAANSSVVRPCAGSGRCRRPWSSSLVKMHLQLLHRRRTQLLQQRLGQFFAGLGEDFAGVAVDDVAAPPRGQPGSPRHADAWCRIVPARACGAVMRLSWPPPPCPTLSVMSKRATSPRRRSATNPTGAVHQAEVVADEEVRQDGLGVQADGLEQDGDRHLRRRSTRKTGCPWDRIQNRARSHGRE